LELALLKRIHKGKALAPVLLVRGAIASGLLSLWRTVIIGFALSAISTKARPFAAE
jgi:hypothetical protein